MTKSQKIQVRQSEVRQRIAELLDVEELTDEQRAELDGLRKEHRDLETKFRAALGTEAEEAEQRQNGEVTDPGESAELRQLRQKSEVRAYLSGAATGGRLDGAPGELNDALEIPRIGKSGGVNIPWIVFDTSGPEARADRIVYPLDMPPGAGPAWFEQRVDSVTGTANLDGATMQRPILQRLFGRDILDALGVRLDAVPSGMSEWPLLTGGVAPAQKSEKAAAPDAVVAAFDTQSLKPRRLTGKYVYTVEQAAQVPDIEQALRRDLADAVKSLMCQQAISGTGNAPQVTGILARLAAPAAPTAINNFADVVGLAAKAVDGIHANMQSEATVLLGVSSYQFASTRFTSVGEVSALNQLQMVSNKTLATSFIPAPETRNSQTHIQDVILHGGMDAMRGDSIAAVWPALEVIRDIYSQAGNGQVVLTWITLWDAYMAFRSGAYKRVALKVA